MYNKEQNDCDKKSSSVGHHCALFLISSRSILPMDETPIDFVVMYWYNVPIPYHLF